MLSCHLNQDIYFISQYKSIYSSICLINSSAAASIVVTLHRLRTLFFRSNQYIADGPKNILIHRPTQACSSTLLNNTRSGSLFCGATTFDNTLRKIMKLKRNALAGVTWFFGTSDNSEKTYSSPIELETQFVLKRKI